MAGNVIPGVAECHPRADWVEATYPVTGPLLPWADIIHAAIHYTAAATTPESVTGVRQWCRNVQRNYVDSRGYSIGYQFAVDRRGAAWELRGWALKCAANAGANGTTVAILLLVNGNDPANAAQIDTVRKIIAEAQRLAGRTLAIHDHANLPGGTTVTSCAGTGVRAQVYARPTSVFTPTPLGGFLMALTDQQQQDIYDRVMGALPGPFADAQRGPGAAGDGHRRFALDDQDGYHIAIALQAIEERLDRVEKHLA